MISVHKRDLWRPPVVVRPVAGESAIGLLMRHCGANGWPRLTDFADQIGTTPTRIRWTKDLSVLAVAIGLPPNGLDALDRRAGASTASLLGHAFPKRRFDVRRRRICPDCIAGCGHMAEWWELAFLQTCPHHGRSLTALCSCGRPLTWTDAKIGRCDRCDGNGDGWPASGHVADLTRHEGWCLGRLGVLPGAPAETLLDTLPLSGALDVIEAVGLLAAGGYRDAMPYPHTFGKTERDIRELGFDTVVGNDIGRLFRSCLATFRRQTGKRLPHTAHEVLGWFGAWIDGYSAYSDTPVLTWVIDALGGILGFDLQDLQYVRMVAVDELAARHRISPQVEVDAAEKAGMTVADCAGLPCVPTRLSSLLRQA